MLYPCQLSPQSLKWAALVIAKPETTEGVLNDYYTHANHHGVGNAQMVIAGKSVAAEDEAADNGLEQIVGKTHATEDAEMVEHLANALEGIPGGNHGGDDHQ